MRVTGGEMKGRKVRARGLGSVSKHGALRATSSKVREAVFNIVREKIEGAVFADLYAGTGAVGMEAMSRGAGIVYFVEADSRRAGELKGLLEGCGCQARSRVFRMSASEFIKRVSGEGTLFDILFLDPPYHSDELDSVLPLLGEGDVLAGDAIVIAEHMKKHPLPDEEGVLRKRKAYKYGDTVLTLYQRAE